MDFLKRNKITIIWSIVFFIASFFTVSVLYAGQKDYVSIKVGSSHIQSYEFMERYQFIHGVFADYGVDINKDKRYKDLVRRDLSIIMIREHMKEELAKQLGVSVSTKEVDKFINENNMFSEEFSKSSQRSMAKEYLLTSKIEDKLMKEVEVNEDLLKEYYENNKDNYIKPTEASFVQLNYKDEAKANNDLNRLKQGISIDSLTDLKEENIIYGIIAKENPESTIEKTVFSLKEGQFSEVVKLGDGYSIFKLEELKGEKHYKFEDVSELVEGDYIIEQADKRFEELIEEFMNKYEIEVIL